MNNPVFFVTKKRRHPNFGSLSLVKIANDVHVHENNGFNGEGSRNVLYD